MKKFEFSLGREELTLLVWLLKYPTLPGLGQKPLGEANSEQIEVMLATAERSLQARGWLKIPEAGVTHINPDLVDLLQKSGDPEITICFSKRKAEGDGRVTHFYVKQGTIVQHSSQKPGIHLLKTLSSVDVIYANTFDGLDLEYPENEDGYDAVIADSLIVAARQTTRESRPDHAKKMLVRNGIGKKVAGAFVQALTNPLSEISLIGVQKRENKTDELLFLEASNGLWLLEPAMEESGVYLTRLRTITRKQTQTNVMGWLETLLG